MGKKTWVVMAGMSLINVDLFKHKRTYNLKTTNTTTIDNKNNNTKIINTTKKTRESVTGLS